MPRLDDATILVTGAGGFLGAAVVRTLVERGARVRALLGPPGSSPADASLDPRRLPNVIASFAEIDDRRAVGELVDGAAIVVHLAGPPSVAASFDAPVEYTRVHVTGTATVLEASLHARVTRFVHVSSAEVYGRPRVDPVTEDHPLSARSPYGAAKIGAEQLVDGYYRALGGDAIVLRPFSLYGPGLGPASVLAAIIRQARRGGPIELADLRPERDYTFVDDAADAIARAAAIDHVTSPALNIGSGRAIAVGDLAACVLDVIGTRAEIREAPDRRRPSAAEILRLVADPSRALRELGWSAAVSLVSGIERTIRWMDSREGGL